MHWIFTLEQLPETTKAIVEIMGDAGVVALYGPMGAGKTTLVHSFCDIMKVQDAVASPTFSIINEYSYPKGIIYHIDCYRLRDESEAIEAGVEDCLYSGEWCFVEWPEKIPHLLPGRHVILSISLVNASMRRLDLEIKL